MKLLDKRIVVGKHVRFYIKMWGRKTRKRLSGRVESINYDTGDVIIFNSKTDCFWNRKLWEVKFYR